MAIEFKDTITVSADPNTVMTHFADIERVAQCVPGASLDGQDDEGFWLGTMTVKFGPKRINFKGRVKCDFEPAAHTGTLTGGGVGAGGSANVKMSTRFTVTGLPEGSDKPEQSRIDILSQAEVSGILASFASTGGIALGRQLMKEFARNFEEEFTGAEPGDRKNRKEVSALGLAVRAALKR